MTAFRYAEQAARLLRAARARIVPRSAAPPENGIAALAEAIVLGAARRRRLRAALALGAAAAVAGVALLFAARPWRSRAAAPEAVVARAGGPRPALFAAGTAAAALTTADGRVQPLPAGHAWRADERLQTNAVGLSLTAGDGTAIDLAPRSDLRLLRADAEQWLRLGGGAVAVHVAKLKPGERFVVLTPDAEVEVRGTRFHVALVPPSADCGHGTPTRVVVDEGVVVVRAPDGEVRVPAGQGWPIGCAAPRLSAAQPSPARLVTPTRPPRPVPFVPPSTLATENDLFVAALRAEHAGDRRAAAQLLDLLLKRFPRSPLEESAQAARARMLAQSAAP